MRSKRSEASLRSPSRRDVCRTEAGAYVSTAERYRAEDSELNQDRHVEDGHAVEDSDAEIEYVAEHGYQQYAGWREQQRTHCDDEDVKWRQL